MALIPRTVRRSPAAQAAGLAVALGLLFGLASVWGCGNGSGTPGSTPGTATSLSTTVPAQSTTTAAASSTTAATPGSTQTTGSPQTTRSSQAGGPQAGGDWPAYHHDAARSGVSGDQAPLGNVRQAWTSPQLDAALYAEPLVVGDRLFVATEANTVYALDAGSGAVAWHTNLGEAVPAGDLPCGNIDPSGITGTPVIDASTSTLYVVANLRSGPHHELFALDLASGGVRWHKAIDAPGLQPVVEQQRGALALTGGRVYVPFGGLYGDCGQYQGAVVSTAADGSGGLAAYIVPTARMAGIWNPAGPVVDTAGDLWVTTGNSAGRSTFDYGNAVIRLSPALEVLDYFAPSDWARLNAGDVDLGSLGPVLVGDTRALAVGKDGNAYLLDAGHLGQVGGAVASLGVGSSAFGAAAVRGSMVFVPCARALVALQVGGDQLAVAWTLSGGSGPPIVAAGAVWALGYDGKLRALDPATGKVLFSSALARPVSRFISLAAAGGDLFVADGDKVVAFALH